MIIKWILSGLKFLSMLAMIFLFLIHHSLLKLLVFDENRRCHFYLKSIAAYAKITQMILNMKIKYKNFLDKKESSLIVVNHLSYVDILILASRYPSLFVTSTEIKETPVLGWITDLAGCFFVERRKSKIILGTKENELRLMKEKIEHGFSILLFPEGTSSDGSRVLPFKATFFQLASDLNIPVRPITLKYLGESGKVVPWYGSMTFIDHLFKVCFSEKIEAEITELDPILSCNKFELSTKSYEAISECYG